MQGLEVGGLVSLSSVDDPGRLAAVIFCQGCPWRCRYCHNPALLSKQAADPVSWSRVEDLLVRRRGLLESVVFSGGEPTLHKGLARAMDRVRSLGYRVALHTAGMLPHRLAPLLDRLDWIGLDIKATFERYPAITGSPASGRHAAESLDLVLQAAASGRLDYEVRTTFHPQLLDENDLIVLANDLAARGVQRYALQHFRPQGCADEGLCAGRRIEVGEATGRHLESLFESFVLR